MYPRVMLVAGDQAVYRLVDRVFARTRFDLLLVEAHDDLLEYAQWAEPDLVLLAHPRLSDGLRACRDLRALRPKVRSLNLVLADREALRDAPFEHLGCADAVLALPLESAFSLEHLRDKWFPEAAESRPRTVQTREALWT